MKTDNLKEIWQHFDAKCDAQINLSKALLKESVTKKSQDELAKYTKTPLMGLLFGLLLQLGLAIFITSHVTQLEFVIPALLINVFVLNQIIASLYQLSVIKEVDLSQSVLTTQMQLAKLQVYRIRLLLVTRLSYPLLWVPVLLVCMKGVFGINLYVGLETWWIAMQYLIGFACLALGIYLSISYAKESNPNKIFKWLMDNIARHDITGKNLVTTIAHLEELQDYTVHA